MFPAVGLALIISCVAPIIKRECLFHKTKEVSPKIIWQYGSSLVALYGKYMMLITSLKFGTKRFLSHIRDGNKLRREF